MKAINTPITITLFLAWMLILPLPVGADSQQRTQFLSAQQAWRDNDFATFAQLTATLQNYPLYHYLRYLELEPQLKNPDRTQVLDFLKQFGESAYGESVRQAWLPQLARQADWQTFIQAYAPQKSLELQCYYVQARLSTGQQTKAALEEAKELWLSGKTPPSNCNIAFEYLYNTPSITQDLLWQRIRLAFEKGQVGLASAVAKYLNSQNIPWFAQWEAMHANPEQLLATFNLPDTPVTRDIIVHGIRRLADKQLDTAVSYWETFQRRYAFSNEQIGQIQRELALSSLKQNHPQAIRWIAAVNKEFVTPEFFDKRFQFAIERQDWQALADFTGDLPEDQQKNLQARYWHARALEQLGRHAEAQQAFTKLAQERDYYGFLAADKISAKYQMQNRPTLFTPLEQERLMKIFSLRAAQEFYQIGMLKEARREWDYAIDKLNPRDQAIAAALASRWGWYDRAVMTATKAGAFDDLEVRFPLPYRDVVTQGALSQSLDLAWVYGIVRQESAFMPDARSRSGAMGLMQLMPATGRYVAKRLGIDLGSIQDIFDIQTNISLGTGYLRQMLDKFGGNYMLATAAYNAGPGRAERWAAERNCMAPDIWVELIPFTETKGYVRRVLFYTSVFENRLGLTPRPMRIALEPYVTCSVSAR